MPRILVHMRCTYLLAGDGEVRYGGIRAVRGGRVRIVRQGVEVQVGQPVHVYRMHVHCTRARFWGGGRPILERWPPDFLRMAARIWSEGRPIWRLGGPGGGRAAR